MPDYGLRPPPYFSGDLPKGILGDAPYGWEHQPNSSTSNTPFNNYFPSEQFVYERLDWQKFKEQLATGLKARPQDAAGMYSNPPFMGAGQMTGPNGAPSWLKDEIGGVRRIVRGYLRRQKVDATDPSSFVRLYFMYNPEEVARTYQSFGESGSVDPNNNAHIEPDGGLASEPWVATMGFTLYFDRQIEVASIEDHPGVMVDLQAFDILAGELIVGNAASGDAVVLPTGAALPANTDVTTSHAGMIQPVSVAQPITAVFSPALAVEGIRRRCVSEDHQVLTTDDAHGDEHLDHVDGGLHRQEQQPGHGQRLRWRPARRQACISRRSLGSSLRRRRRTATSRLKRAPRLRWTGQMPT
jgi:hypothetical protein